MIKGVVRYLNLEKLISVYEAPSEIAKRFLGIDDETQVLYLDNNL